MGWKKTVKSEMERLLYNCLIYCESKTPLLKCYLVQVICLFEKYTLIMKLMFKYLRILEKYMFFKDGYSDVRGRFDYRTLSTDQIRSTQKLAILISTEKMGSIIKEIKVPLEFITKTNLF